MSPLAGQRRLLRPAKGDIFMESKRGHFHGVATGSVLTIDNASQRCCDAVMRRPLRFQYPGANYKLMSRSDRREEFFRDDTDRRTFFSTLVQGRISTLLCLGR